MTYKYDVFLSYRNHGRWRDWIELHFLPNLEHYLGEDLGHSIVDPKTSQPKIFYDKNNLSGGQRWRKELKEGVLSSLVLVPLFSRQYFGSPSCRKELAYMLAKENHSDISGLVVPVVIHDGEDFPSIVQEIQWLKLSQYANVRMLENSPKAEKLCEKIMKWTPELKKAIMKAPTYDTAWENLAITDLEQKLTMTTESQQTSVPSLGEG